MTAPRLLILGAGGHGKVAADCARAHGEWPAIEFFDDRWPSLSACSDWPVVGTGADLLRRDRDGAAFVAIGDAATRLDWIARLRAAGFELATIVHPRAIVSPGAAIGPASLVVAGAVVNIGAGSKRASSLIPAPRSTMIARSPPARIFARARISPAASRSAAAPGS